MDKKTYEAALKLLAAMEMCVDRAIAQLEALEADELADERRIAA